MTRIREALGDDVWLAVDANQRYDYATALSMGHFFEEEIGADWFEEPISCEDRGRPRSPGGEAGDRHRAGETLFSRDEFLRYLQRGAVDIVQPDVTRLGGLTPWLKMATLAEQHQRPVAPHLLPEIAVHLACGLPVGDAWWNTCRGSIRRLSIRRCWSRGAWCRPSGLG